MGKVLKEKMAAPKAILRFEKVINDAYNVAHPPPLSKRGQEAVDRVNALLDHVANSSNIPELTLNQWSCDWIMTFKDDAVCIDEALDVWMQLDSLDSAAKFVHMKFHIFSNQSSTGMLKKWLNDLYVQYVYNRDAAFTGERLYLFEAVSPNQCFGTGSGARVQLQTEDDGPTPLQQLQAIEFEKKRQLIMHVRDKPMEFVQRSFVTNKRFTNLFGPSVRNIEARLNFFQKNETIYNERGIPYRFGALISGEPGCGKTSIIQAIAAETERHIILVNFESVVTAERLRNLFYSDIIHIHKDGNGASVPVRIPIDKRLFVLEDIDALGPIVLQRDDEHHGYDVFGALGTIPEQVTLSDILNVFDGNLQNKGRVMVVTTNFAEKLDRALVRAGRFDCVTSFEGARKETIIEAFEFFFSHIPRDDPSMQKATQILNSLPEGDKTMTMADVHSVFFDSFQDAESAAKEIAKRLNA